jgi:DNA-binding transcriptional regulator YdaS (Cro superfamily)
MKVLDHIEIAIRQAFATCVDAVGGGKNMAAVLGYDEPKISRLQNCENTETQAATRAWLRANEIVKADLLAGQPIILSALAALEGCTVQRAERNSMAGWDVHKHLSCLAKEFGEAVNEMSDGGAPSIAKARRIRSEIQDLVNRGNDCIAELDLIIAGSKIVSVK